MTDVSLLLGRLLLGKLLARQEWRQLLHLRRIGARAVQVGAAGAVDGARVIAIERLNVTGAARRIVQIDVRQRFPPAPQADHFAADFARSIDYGLDDGIQTGNVSATG